MTRQYINGNFPLFTHINYDHMGNVDIWLPHYCDINRYGFNWRDVVSSFPNYQMKPCPYEENAYDHTAYDHTHIGLLFTQHPNGTVDGHIHIDLNMPFCQWIQRVMYDYRLSPSGLIMHLERAFSPEYLGFLHHNLDFWGHKTDKNHWQKGSLHVQLTDTNITIEVKTHDSH